MSCTSPFSRISSSQGQVQLLALPEHLLLQKVFWYKPSSLPGVGQSCFHELIQTLLCLSTTSELAGLSVWICQYLLWDTLLGLKMFFLCLNSPEQAHGVCGQCVWILQLLAWNSRTGLPWMEWDRNCWKRQNDPERTGRERKKESSENRCQEYLFLP